MNGFDPNLIAHSRVFPFQHRSHTRVMMATPTPPPASLPVPLCPLSCMRLALAEAAGALTSDEVPVGCIIAHQPTGRIVGSGRNQTNQTKNVTTHITHTTHMHNTSHSHQRALTTTTTAIANRYGCALHQWIPIHTVKIDQVKLEGRTLSHATCLFSWFACVYACVAVCLEIHRVPVTVSLLHSNPCRSVRIHSFVTSIYPNVHYM